MKREHQEGGAGSSAGGFSGGYRMGGLNGKCKQVEEEAQQDAGVDELLAALGYNVRSSNMAEVAQRLEQLEMVMGSAQEDGLSHLGTEAVHYNPSDLATWIDSMLSELNVPPSLDPANNWGSEHNRDDAESSSGGGAGQRESTGAGDFATRTQQRPQQQQTHIFDSSDYDLKAAISGINGGIVYGTEQQPLQREKKRLKSEPVPPLEPRPVVLVDSQENGIWLVHTLIECAEAIQRDNLKAAEALVKQIGILAVSQAGAMRKVATYFAEALARRIYRLYPQDLIDSFSDILQMHFYETCPYLKFAHFTANQAILEAFAGKSRVHVIDFSMKQGMQWPALMQALALRPGGPPAFRLTGIGPPQPDNSDALQQVGWKLAQLAETIHVEFEYRGFVANSLADLEAYMLDVRPSEVEVVAVNSIFELHRLLAQPGAIEKVLRSVRAMRPKIVTLVEQEANHNQPVFLDRFNEALHYYSTLFDSLEGCGMSPPNSQDQVMSEVYLGRQICNVVACEGAERVERHETLSQWRLRMAGAGFAPVHLGSNAFKQASMLLALFAGGDGYRVEENNGCLMLGWHTRPLIATSAWQIALQ